MHYFPLPVVLLCVISAPISANDIGTEQHNTGWRLNFDNDVLTGFSTDRDYTGGGAVTLSGKRAQQYPVSIDSWRAGIDGLVNFSDLFQEADFASFHSQQYGVTLFTPDDIDSNEPVYDDRPYASLFFISNSEFTVVPAKNVAYVSRLTLGILGLDLAEDIQATLHAITGSDVPNGWQHQVSAGGEPTAMMTWAMQNNLYTANDHQLKAEYEANLGFITDVNAGFSWRWGQINSPWWAFNPYQSKYVQQSMPVFASEGKNKSDEFYIWAGGRVNLRIYNALLQGQFRDSEVTVSNDDMQRMVAEYWLGVTREFVKRYYVSAFFRGNTDEFKGPSARNGAWVGLVLTMAY
jgi:hypothetical protein